MLPNKATLICLTGAGLFLGLWLLVTLQADQRALQRHFGQPLPDSISGVRYQSQDWFGLYPEPSYRLRFRAASNEVAMLVARLELKPAAPGSPEGTFRPGSVTGPEWWRFDSDGAEVKAFAREKGKRCVIEWFWWDRSNHAVYYYLSCP